MISGSSRRRQSTVDFRHGRDVSANDSRLDVFGEQRNARIRTSNRARPQSMSITPFHPRIGCSHADSNVLRVLDWPQKPCGARCLSCMRSAPRELVESRLVGQQPARLSQGLRGERRVRNRRPSDRPVAAAIPHAWACPCPIPYVCSVVSPHIPTPLGSFLPHDLESVVITTDTHGSHTNQSRETKACGFSNKSCSAGSCS